MKRTMSYLGLICISVAFATGTLSCNNNEEDAPINYEDGPMQPEYSDCVFEERDMYLEIPASPGKPFIRHFNMAADVSFYWATCEDLFADDFDQDVVSRTTTRDGEDAIRVLPHHRLAFYHPGDVLSSWIYETNHEIFSSLEKESVRFVNEPEDKNEQFTIAPGHGEWITAMVDKKTCSVWFYAKKNTTGQDRMMCFCFHAPTSKWGTVFVNNVIKVVQKGE